MGKYFNELLGNEQSRERIGRAIEGGTLPHAYLIGGPDGSGKRTFAKLIAAGVNCERRGTAEAIPCMNCNNCKRIMNEAFVDLKFFGRKKDRATIGVDDMRLLKEDAMLSAAESDHKIYVIEDAQALTVESQNALLNVLEEPPIGVLVILLASECDKILTTIKSRVQSVSMTRFTDDEIRRYVLARVPSAEAMMRTEPERFAGIIKSSKGVIGRAMLLLQGKGAEADAADRDSIATIVRAFSRRSSYADLHSAMLLLPQKRTELIPYLERLTEAVRDLVVVKQSESEALEFFASRDEAEQITRGIGTKRLLYIYDALMRSYEYCSMNANVALVLADLEERIMLA